MAKARGLPELVEEYLKPAIEAETVDPRGLVVEEAERGIKAVIRDVRVMREGGRPRVIVEYEVNGVTKSFSFIWGVTTRGRVIAGVNLNDERALALAALLDDETIRGKRNVVTLYAKHLFALARLKGVGWELLSWYAGVMRE
ncbi:PaRep2b protein [Pyrobaculum aerophilum]|uniref:PaRep2b protein n=1 Tax=Pyrobaculum aerophilum TaxID=13773 RepID=UPI002868A407|nr:PaRep2b protein [Pyrobaculum aerophilum]